MKTPIYFAAAFLSLVALFTASTGQAEVIDCNSTTIVEILQAEEECPTCPPPPECPPVLACDLGYSCQPDAVEPPDGEQQQYPSGNTEDFVQAITGGGLVDIALDDPRWGSREEGEVYARENEDFITWFWPSGGMATFDPTRLGSPVAWYDYRTASDTAGGGPHTSMGVSAGMGIHFSDFGGGVSIFQRKGDVEPPPVGQCDFLNEYTNPAQVALPAERVYPMGQKMMVSAWGAESGRIKELADAGFTMGGPNWNPSSENLARDLPLFEQAGLRVAYRITHGASMAEELFARMDNGAKEEVLFSQAKSSLLRIVNDPRWNKLVDVWLTGTEELSTRMPTSVKQVKGLRYLKKMSDLVQQYDPQERPMWMSDVTGVSQSNMMNTHRFTGMVGPQNYLDRCCAGSGYPTDAQAGAAARKMVSTAKALNRDYPNSRPYAATMSHGLHYTPESQWRIDNMDKIIQYWVFTAFNEGLQGMQVYSWYNHYASLSVEARANGKAAYKAAVKLLTDNGLDYAYLWGDRRNDVTVSQTAGETSVSGLPVLSSVNIQYGDTRYIVLTNASLNHIKVRLSNLPDCGKLVDMKTGSTINHSGSTEATLGTLGVRLYKVTQ